MHKHFPFVEVLEKTGDNRWEVAYRNIFARTKTEVRLTEDVPRRVLAWKTTIAPAAQGSVVFDATGAETFVTFVLSYDPPGGRLGDIMNTMFKFPVRRLEHGLSAWVKAMENP